MAPLKERLSKRDLPEILAELLGSVHEAQRQPVQEVVRPTYKRLQKLSTEQVSELVATYRDGATVLGLAEQFRVHRTTVMAVLDREGVARRSPGRVLSPEEIERASQMYRDGLNLRAVGAALGADYRVVRRALVGAGVKLRRAGHPRP